jgi:hypothetical protein
VYEQPTALCLLGRQRSAIRAGDARIVAFVMLVGSVLGLLLAPLQASISRTCRLARVVTCA